MKLYKIVLFIFSILFMLALTCHLFPREGVDTGSLHLDFPRLSEVLAVQNNDETEAEPELTPEQLLELKMQEVLAAKDSTFLDFCYNSPIRISMPRIDTISDTRDLTYLDTFFAALDSARSRQVRIVHYGDSQIEEDRITASLREHFQEQFGGYGVGLLPAVQTVTKMTVRQSSSVELPYYLAYGPAEARKSDRAYGPMAQMSHAYGNVTLRYRTVDNEKFPHCKSFDKVTLLRSDEEGRMSFEVQEFDSARSTVNVKVEGPTDIYGVMLDSKTGVVMDNIPMRGCSGAIFTGITRKTIEPFFQHENVQLIILQYGGNSVPYLKSEESLDKYCQSLRRQIAYFHDMVPEARILFIGPSDMSTYVKGNLATYPHLPHLVEMLEEAVTAEGAAFWNMYAAMGGKGSMIQWVNARPQLAGEDYVHFTHKGAEKVSELLYETITTYYQYYKFRIGELSIEIPSDEETI